MAWLSVDDWRGVCFAVDRDRCARLPLGRALALRCCLCDPRSDAPLHRCPLFDQFGIARLVFGHVGCGSIFSRLPLPQQPRNCRFLRCGASLEPFLDFEIGSSFAASCGEFGFLFGLPGASSIQLALQESQPIDLGLRRVEESGRPLKTRLQILTGVGIDKQRDRQQVGLLLILITDYLPGLRLLGLQSSLSGHHGSDSDGQVRPGLLQLGRYLGVLGLGHSECLAGRRQPRCGRIQLVLGLVDRNRRRTECLGGFIEIALGLGDLLLDLARCVVSSSA